MNRFLLLSIIGLSTATVANSLAQNPEDLSKAAGEALAESTEIKGPDNWETTISAGTALTRGNSETVNATGRLFTEKLHGSTLASILFEGAYGETKVRDEDGSKSTDQNIGNVHGEFTLKQIINGCYVYEGLSGSHDTIAEVKYRAMIGAGLGAFLIKTDDLRLTVELGGGYLFEEVASESDDYAVLRMAERLDYKLSKTAKVWEMVEFLPKASDFDNSLLNCEAGVEAAMTEKATIGLVASFKYDNEPAEGVKKEDFSLTAQVSFRL